MTMNNVIMGYGVTLRRPMSPQQAELAYDAIDYRRAIGAVSVIVKATYTPNVLDVECEFDGIDPQQAIIALATAAIRLGKLYGKAPPPTAIVDTMDAADLRVMAEELVDLCRKSRPRGSGFISAFDYSREQCVSAVLVALARAPITPGALLSGASK